MILSLIHLPVPFLTVVNPAFAVIGIFYLTLWQPRHLPLFGVFMCGLVYDAFQSTLFGTHALLFLLFRLSVARLRQQVGFIEPPFMNWAYFVLSASLYLIVEWLVAAVQLGSFIPNDFLVEKGCANTGLLSAGNAGAGCCNYPYPVARFLACPSALSAT